MYTSDSAEHAKQNLLPTFINKGEIKAGIKYIPLFVLCSISAHYMFVELLKYVFGGFFV